jgi:hypothetical protein
MLIRLDWTMDEHYDSVPYDLIGCSPQEEHLKSAEWVRGEWRSDGTIYLFPHLDDRPAPVRDESELRRRRARRLTSGESGTFRTDVLPFIKRLLLAGDRERRKEEYLVLLVASKETIERALGDRMCPATILTQRYFYFGRYDEEFRSVSSRTSVVDRRWRSRSEADRGYWKIFL